MFYLVAALETGHFYKMKMRFFFLDQIHNNVHACIDHAYKSYMNRINFFGGTWLFKIISISDMKTCVDTLLSTKGSNFTCKLVSYMFP